MSYVTVVTPNQDVRSTDQRADLVLVVSGFAGGMQQGSHIGAGCSMINSMFYDVSGSSF